jgi:hypothetical protein
LRGGRAIWPESHAWLGCGLAITPEPPLRNSIVLCSSVARATPMHHGETATAVKNSQGSGNK